MLEINLHLFLASDFKSTNLLIPQKKKKKLNKKSKTNNFSLNSRKKKHQPKS